MADSKSGIFLPKTVFLPETVMEQVPQEIIDIRPRPFEGLLVKIRTNQAIDKPSDGTIIKNDICWARLVKRNTSLHVWDSTLGILHPTDRWWKHCLLPNEPGAGPVHSEAQYVDLWMTDLILLLSNNEWTISRITSTTNNQVELTRIYPSPEIAGPAIITTDKLHICRYGCVIRGGQSADLIKEAFGADIRRKIMAPEPELTPEKAFPVDSKTTKAPPNIINLLIETAALIPEAGDYQALRKCLLEFSDVLKKKKAIDIDSLGKILLCIKAIDPTAEIRKLSALHELAVASANVAEYKLNQQTGEIEAKSKKLLEEAITRRGRKLATDYYKKIIEDGRQIGYTKGFEEGRKEEREHAFREAYKIIQKNKDTKMSTFSHRLFHLTDSEE
jgi:hypothetical protein